VVQNVFKVPNVSALVLAALKKALVARLVAGLVFAWVLVVPD
jgi:hypothetical protein